MANPKCKSCDDTGRLMLGPGDHTGIPCDRCPGIRGPVSATVPSGPERPALKIDPDYRFDTRRRTAPGGWTDAMVRAWHANHDKSCDCGGKLEVEDDVLYRKCVRCRFPRPPVEQYPSSARALSEKLEALADNWTNMSTINVTAEIRSLARAAAGTSRRLTALEQHQRARGGSVDDLATKLRDLEEANEARIQNVVQLRNSFSDVATRLETLEEQSVPDMNALANRVEALESQRPQHRTGGSVVDRPSAADMHAVVREQICVLRRELVGAIPIPPYPTLVQLGRELNDLRATVANMNAALRRDARPEMFRHTEVREAQAAISQSLLAMAATVREHDHFTTAEYLETISEKVFSLEMAPQ